MRPQDGGPVNRRDTGASHLSAGACSGPASSKRMYGLACKFMKINQEVKMVGMGRFELPTPRTPSECSTRLSHIPTVSGAGAPKGYIDFNTASGPAECKTRAMRPAFCIFVRLNFAPLNLAPSFAL